MRADVDCSETGSETGFSYNKQNHVMEIMETIQDSLCTDDEGTELNSSRSVLFGG